MVLPQEVNRSRDRNLLESNFGVFQDLPFLAVAWWESVMWLLRQRRNGTWYEILPPQMSRNCILPDQSLLQKFMKCKKRRLPRFIAHFCPDITRRKGVHLCQSVKFADLFSIACWAILILWSDEKEGSSCFACCIFFITYWTPSSPRLWSITPCIPLLPLAHLANISKYG